MEIQNRDGRNRTEHSQGDCQKPDLCICKSMNFYGEGGTCKGIIRAQDPFFIYKLNAFVIHY